MRANLAALGYTVLICGSIALALVAAALIGIAANPVSGQPTERVKQCD